MAEKVEMCSTHYLDLILIYSMVDNFDQLLDQALLEFEAQSKGPSEEEIQAGSYSDTQELAGFLAEISEEDEALAESELSVISDVEQNRLDDEDNVLFNDFKEDPDSWFSKSTWVADDKGQFVRRSDGELFIGEGPDADSKTREEKISSSIKKYNKNKDLRKVEINRTAFDQKILPLNDRISVEQKRLVIELLTKPQKQLIVKYENYITNRITKLLAPAIPKPIKLAYLKWPWIFVANPGFLYKTSSHFGEVKQFWVTPKLPYYFKQGTEQTILEERDASLMPYFLDRIDRAIHAYYKAKDNLVKREVMYASRMINIKGNTYYHLLQLNPFWFEKLYLYVKTEREQLAGDLL